MVNIGNIIIDDFTLLTFIGIFGGIFYWYYSRILKSLSVKVSWEFKAGDYRVYKGEWNVNENTVTVIRSRKDKQVLKKSHEPRLFHFSNTQRVLMFRSIEGSKKTQSWTLHKDFTGKDNLGYEGIALVQHYKQKAIEQSVSSLKGQYMGIAIGLGFGMVIGIMFAVFFPAMFS